MLRKVFAPCMLAAIPVVALASGSSAPKPAPLQSLKDIGYFQRSLVSDYAEHIPANFIAAKNSELPLKDTLDLQLWSEIKSSAEQLETIDAGTYSQAVAQKNPTLLRLRQNFVEAFHTGLLLSYPARALDANYAHVLLESKTLQQITLEHLALLMLARDLPLSRQCEEISRSLVFLSYVSGSDSSDTTLGFEPLNNLLLVTMLYQSFINSDSTDNSHSCNGKVPTQTLALFATHVLKKYGFSSDGFFSLSGGGHSYGGDVQHNSTYSLPLNPGWLGQTFENSGAIWIRANATYDSQRAQLGALAERITLAPAQESSTSAFDSDIFLPVYAARSLESMR